MKEGESLFFRGPPQHPAEFGYLAENAEMTREQTEQQIEYLKNKLISDAQSRESYIKNFRATWPNLPEETEAQRNRKAQLWEHFEKNLVPNEDEQWEIEWTEKRIEGLERLLQLIFQNVYTRYKKPE